MTENIIVDININKNNSIHKKQDNIHNIHKCFFNRSNSPSPSSPSPTSSLSSLSSSPISNSNISSKILFPSHSYSLQEKEKINTEYEYDHEHTHTDSNTKLNISIMDNIDESIIITNLNNQIIEINHQSKILFKIDNELNIIGENINKLITDFELFNRLHTYKIIEEDGNKIYIIKKKYNADSNENDDNINILNKECFLFNISHEIRTPLNGIIGMTQILKDKLNDDGNYQEYVDIISSCGIQLMDILNDILDYAKITSGNISLLSSNFNLLECIEEIHDIILPKSNGKNLDISYNIDPTIPDFIYCDKKRLKQILINLLSNSIKFTEHGFVKTDITLIKRIGIKIYLAFTVYDSGIGIAKQYLEKIFEPYVQVNNKLSRKYEGTGLGLSISRQLAKLLKGDIKADSILGKGSTFTLTIEAVDPTSSSTSSTSSTLSSNTLKNNLDEDKYQIKTPPPPIYINVSCLVIDDNPNNRITLHQILTSLGIKTILASSGEEALLIVNTYTFDIIFLDICMPTIDGIKTCEELRKCIKEPQPPIIATSSIDGFITHITPGLFDDILIKPIKKKSLIRFLEKYIKNKNK
jgi:signal transduction histidine kinase/CheY-like chemotaxis protein